MKKAWLFVFLAAAVAAASIIGPRANAASDDNAQINALYRQFLTAFRHKDLNAVMAVYVHDNTLFVFDVGMPREHVGWTSYRADWKSLFSSMKGNPTNVSMSELGITIDGDVAYTHSVQSVTANMGNVHALTVRVTDVLRKIDGKWLIVQEHVSVPINFETLKPDLMSRS